MTDSTLIDVDDFTQEMDIKLIIRHKAFLEQHEVMENDWVRFVDSHKLVDEADSPNKSSARGMPGRLFYLYKRKSPNTIV